MFYVFDKSRIFYNISLRCALKFTTFHTKWDTNRLLYAFEFLRCSVDSFPFLLVWKYFQSIQYWSMQVCHKTIFKTAFIFVNIWISLLLLVCINKYNSFNECHAQIQFIRIDKSILKFWILNRWLTAWLFDDFSGWFNYHILWNENSEKRGWQTSQYFSLWTIQVGVDGFIIWHW